MNILRLISLLSLSLLAACMAAPDQPPLTAGSNGKPALWKVSDAKAGHAYLFGTVHTLPPGVDWQSAALNTAIADTDGLVTEVTGLDDIAAISALYSKLGVSKGLPPLEQRVPPALQTALSDARANSGTAAGVLDRMETWAAALTLSNSISSDLGALAEFGVDASLQNRFKIVNKPHSGLETVAQQLGYFDNLSEVDQRLMLAAVLRGKDNAREQTQALIDNWMRGDVDALLKNSDNGILASPSLRETLLDARNRRWADQVTMMLGQGRKPFVALGAAHMAGAGGLPSLLAARGYKVTRIQ